MEDTEVEIADVRTVGPDTVALTLESPPEFDARPGQFVQARATVDDEEVTRHYSISSPTAAETFEVTVGVDPEGSLSPRLADADAGETIVVAGPFGRVYYESEPAVVVLAAGPGVGPAVGIAERSLRDGGDAVVVYRADDLVHERRLSRLSLAGADVRLVGDRERFEDAVSAVLDRGQVFVYGFEEFVETAESAIETAGGDPLDAKIENFG